MERLTEECWRNLDPWECCGKDYYCQRGCYEEGGCTNGCIVPKLYASLASYEDTGIEQKEIDSVFIHGVIEENKRLKELAQAEKDGRMVMLPCKVGDRVYIIRDEKIIIETGLVESGN